MQLRDAKLRPEDRDGSTPPSKRPASGWESSPSKRRTIRSPSITSPSATLQAAPDGPWAATAQYNLGRAYEANGQLQKAIEMYEDDDSPQRHGNLLRARRLKRQLAAPQAAGP